MTVTTITLFKLKFIFSLKKVLKSKKKNMALGEET